MGLCTRLSTIDTTVRSLIVFNKPLSRCAHRVRAFVVRASLEIKLPVEIFPSRDGAIVNVKKKKKIIIIMREKRQEGNFREGKERGKERKIVMEGRIIVTWGVVDRRKFHGLELVSCGNCSY